MLLLFSIVKLCYFKFECKFQEAINRSIAELDVIRSATYDLIDVISHRGKNMNEGKIRKLPFLTSLCYIFFMITFNYNLRKFYLFGTKIFVS